VEDVAELVFSHVATSDLDEGAHGGADHVAEETVGFDGEDMVVATLFPKGAADVAKGGFDVGMCLAEGGEVALLEEDGAGVVHALVVEREGESRDGGAGEGGLVVDDPILVGAAGGVESRVRILAYASYRMECDIGREDAVELVAEAVGVERRAIGGMMVEVRYHLPSVHARVGTPGSDYLRRGAQYRGECTLKLLLHGESVGLQLPTMVAGAVIFEVDEVAQGDYEWWGRYLRTRELMSGEMRQR